MRIVQVVCLFLGVVLFFSCDKENNNPSPGTNDKGQTELKIDPSEKFQKMIGFGGALTWYSDRIVTSPKSEEIYQLIFEDLGMDVLRLMNWYYPSDYPNNKSPESMVSLPYDSDYKTMFQATNTFYKKAKSYNSDIRVLLSSWGPPSTLKSNDNLREGTLKKREEGSFLYNVYAEYWNDILDHIDFSPDYISIQNEPGYTNPDWITCEWGPQETTSLPAYSKAFDSVYFKIKDRPNVPVMIGPEAENLNAFNGFASTLRDKEHCPVYAFHPYNFNRNSSMEEVASGMSSLFDGFGDKPNIMTEFSGMSWMNTARIIYQTLVHANTSGYIYWETVWNSPDQAMIFIDRTGAYTITPFYYVMKHFSKYISENYIRIDVDPRIAYVEAVGFMSPDEKNITIVLINPEKVTLDYELTLPSGNIREVNGFQSVEGDYFKRMEDLGSGSFIPVPGQSVTTLDIRL